MSDSKNHAIDTVLFDIGGVIIPLGGLKDMKDFIPENETLETLKDKWIASEAVRGFESGRTGPEEFALSVCEELGLRLSPSVFLEKFENWPLEISGETLSILRLITSRLNSATLSNTNSIHWDKIVPRLGGLFANHFPSHKTGLLKPDPQAFLKASKTLGTEPSRIVFFDDTEINVKSAIKSGFNAYCVKSVAESANILSEILQETF